MIFQPTPLEPACLVLPERIDDERGYFARTWCEDEFGAVGLNTTIVQCSTSYNRRAGTLRGVHYQISPHEESKLVRCTAGRAFDVIVDLRTESPSFLRWYGVELSAANGVAMYVPERFAHGFQTLEDDTELFYQMSQSHHPESARGFRWDDPAVGVAWPRINTRTISAADHALPPLVPSELAGQFPPE